LASSRSKFTSIIDSQPALVAIDVLVCGCHDVRAKLLGLRKGIGLGLRGRGWHQKSDCGDDCSSDRPPAGARQRPGPPHHVFGTHLAMPGFPIYCEGMEQNNVFGEPLEVCSVEPLTGFYRDGYCNTGPDDLGSHTVCTVVTAEFLEHQKSVGNDLSTPHPQFGFPGLKPGDRWGVCASRWLQAYADGIKAPVVLKATNEAALSIVPIEALTECGADAPDDISDLD